MSQSFFTHTCCKIHFTLFCREFTFVEIYPLFSGKIVFAETFLVYKNGLFLCLDQDEQDYQNK